MSILETVLITRNCKGAPDGTKVRMYYSGQEYNLPSELARCFVEELHCAVYPAEEMAQLEAPPEIEAVNTSNVISPPWLNKNE